MRQYYFYLKNTQTQEAIGKTYAWSRLSAAKYFSATKQLPLKAFLKIFSISR
jgi:hypothetical protein